MLKLIKWDFIDYAKRSYWLYLAYAAVLAITAVLPDDIRYLSAVVDGAGAIFGLLSMATRSFVYNRADKLAQEGFDTARSVTAVPPWRYCSASMILASAQRLRAAVTELLWTKIDRYGMSRTTCLPTCRSPWNTRRLLELLTRDAVVHHGKELHFPRNRAGFVTAP